MEIQRPRTPNPHEHSRKISKIQSRPPPPYPETWSSPSCLPSPSPRAAPFHSRAGGRRGGRPSPAAAAAPRTRPPGAPGGGSPPSSPPPQWWELAWPEGKPARCPPAGGRASKIPESEFTTLPNGLKYYDIKVGSGAQAVKRSRVAVHYVAKWKGITFMTSRQGLGVGGGTPYGFDVGNSDRGNVLKGLDLGVEGMKVGAQRLIIVPPELAYGKKGVQEIPPNATIELDVELLSIKQSPFGTPVKIIEG
ncbi:peptidyl-prolyl cis-trans isomerase FKBP16-4, chloroplastic-like isoform X4 [Panicum virgatum]|uniref:peptidyl-prolyl cis-trans isomerase FKBP16-4, chloroplastic-like isoform X4 n=1 Tax=Panicum virgatum TaxID=38727 RepID=UPI0019D69098|nr:peptidyl-prolyl cis-trans isomerase FKBP16-4, chloroplastic-like isoform X4 [Panicum virgatum]